MLITRQFSRQNIWSFLVLVPLFLSFSFLARAQDVSLSPTSLSWGSVAVGQTSGAKALTVTNNQSVPLTFSSISIPAGSDFVESSTTCPTTPSTLAASASCTVSVQFRPLAQGTRTGTLTLVDNAPSQTQTASLSGGGIVGSVLFSPTSVSFTSVEGTTSAAQTVTLTNTLSTPVTLTSFKTSAQFAQTNTCPVSPAILAAQASCSFSVTYSPTSSSASTGTVTVGYTAATSESIQLYLSGTPQVNYVPLSPTSYNFGNVVEGSAGASTTFTLTNSYSQAITVGSITTTLTDYTTSSTCPVSPSTLAVGQNCAITVTFTPITLGTRSDTLTVASSAPGSPTVAALTGVGITPPTGISFAPTGLSWNSTQVGQTAGTKSVTLTNNNSSAVTISSIAISSNFLLSSSNCPLAPSTIAAGATCTLTAAFQPLSAGSLTGSITVIDSDPSSPQAIPLSGTAITGPILFAATSLSFSGVEQGQTSAAQTVTLTNTLSTPVTLASFQTLGQFAQTNTCPVSPATLAPQTSCSFSVTYMPTSSNVSNGTVTVGYSAATTGSIQLYLSGTPQVNYVPLNPISYNFGNVPEGATGSATTFTLTNNYSQAVTISSIATTLADYTTSSTCPVSPSTLAVGQNCAITVTFTPTTLGTRSDTLTVSDDAPGSPTMAALTGIGVTPPTGVSSSASSLSWGSTQVGQTAGAKTVTLTNNDATAVTISSIAISSNFVLSSSNCPLAPNTIAAGASCTLSVAFQPLSTGTISGSIIVTDSDPSSPLTITLNGTAVAGPILFSPTSVSFPSTIVGATSPTQTATLTNNLATSVNISNIAVTAQFSQTNNCPATLPANGTCTFTVMFAPTSTGSKTGSVSVTTGLGTESLYLSGPATANTGNGAVGISPKVYNFSASSSQAAGTTSAPGTITLTNGLAVTLNISSIQIAAPFNQTNNCGTALTSGQSCVINVTYSPTAVGYSSATLTITDDAASSPQTAAISGNAVTAIATIPVIGGLGFYDQIVQTSSSAQTLTITNNLSTPLTLNSINSTADYPFTTNCVGSQGNGTLASQASCVVYVSFDPQAVGSRPANLSVSNSFSSSPLTIPLTGTGISGTVGPQVTVTPNLPCTAPSGTQQFTATPANVTSSSIKWYVDGILGGNSTHGTITQSGFYTAPTATGTQTITASSIGSTNVSGTTTVSVTTAPIYEIYPYTSSIPPSGQQTFQAQVCTVPDASPVTYTVDGIAGGNATVGTITSSGVYTAPPTAGKHTVKVTDPALGKTSGAVVTVYPAITVNFGSRTSTTYPIQANLFGAARGESLQSIEDRSLLTDAGITVSRLYGQIPLVYAGEPVAPGTLPTPDWTKVDPIIAQVQAAGQHVMLQLSYSPPFLQPTTGKCAANSFSAPTNVTTWAQIAASYVAHMDANFPGVVQDYEIWNEPNASGMCSSNNLNNYMAIYAAAAPLMKQQAAIDGVTIRVGGPVLSGLSTLWINTLLGSSTTAPYVDFISYHNYFFGGTALEVKWDTYNGNTSLYQATTDPSNGAAEIYSKVYAAVKTGKQPLGAKTPIYITEFNSNFAFAQDCCRSNPIYAPVWNGLYLTDLLNSVYTGLPAPTRLVYFAGSAYPWFCLIGTEDQNMDCSYSRGSTPQPYPQYYTFQLLASSNYLGLSEGGYMAPTVTPPNGGGGIVVTAFYNASQDAIMITNPTANNYTNIPLTLSALGFTSPQGTLYQIMNGASINASSLPLTPVGSTYSATISIPPYSVMGISIK